MYLVLIAWLYVALMMAAAEATSPSGTLLGALLTFLLYGLGPVVLVGYVLDAPRRRRAIKAREMAAPQIEPPGFSVDPDTGREASARTELPAVAPVREEP